MLGTIESTHGKLIEKIRLLKKSMEILQTINGRLCTIIKSKNCKDLNCIRKLELLHINLLQEQVETMETKYNLAVVNILNIYYNIDQKYQDEELNTSEYYRIIVSENFLSSVDSFIMQIIQITNTIRKISQSNIISKGIQEDIDESLDTVQKIMDKLQNIEIYITVTKKNYEICKCGTRMNVIPEYSELHCPNTYCRKIKTIIGAVFRDNQFYPQEGQRTKHGGYDTNRHYKFWSERLQALENTNFDDEDLKNIEYVIKRDSYERQSLNCELMREILKDPKVNATHLNDHAPLLVKTFGGPAPPQLDFNENKLTSIRFNKVMNLYDIINPDGGNKPYYPYFIYKIWEEMFKDNPNKLRLLDYIHLQSRDTVIKNDEYYEKIAALANPCDGIVYKPTIPDREM